jgi:hypothetical protein
MHLHTFAEPSRKTHPLSCRNFGTGRSSPSKIGPKVKKLSAFVGIPRALPTTPNLTRIFLSRSFVGRCVAWSKTESGTIRSSDDCMGDTT